MCRVRVCVSLPSSTQGPLSAPRTIPRGTSSFLNRYYNCFLFPRLVPPPPLPLPFNLPKVLCSFSLPPLLLPPSFYPLPFVFHFPPPLVPLLFLPSPSSSPFSLALLLHLPLYPYRYALPLPPFFPLIPLLARAEFFPCVNYCPHDFFP